MSMDSTTNSVDIDGLDSNVEYQFQVVAIAVVNGQTIEGERYEVNVLVVTSFVFAPGTICDYNFVVFPLCISTRWICNVYHHHSCGGDLSHDPAAGCHCYDGRVWHLLLVQC